MRAFGKQRESRFFSWLELENLKNEHYLTLLPYVVRKLKYECFLKLSRCNIQIFCTLTEKNLSEKLLNWKNIRKKRIKYNSILFILREKFPRYIRKMCIIRLVVKKKSNKYLKKIITVF